MGLFSQSTKKSGVPSTDLHSNPTTSRARLTRDPWEVLFSTTRKTCYSTLAETPLTNAQSFDLSPNLLDYIFSYPQLPSKACLALTSKFFYKLYGSVLRTDWLRFPRLSCHQGERYTTNRGILSPNDLSNPARKPPLGILRAVSETKSSRRISMG